MALKTRTFAGELSQPTQNTEPKKLHIPKKTEMNPTNAPPANYSLAAVTATIEGTAKNKKTPGHYTARNHSPPAGCSLAATDLAI